MDMWFTTGSQVTILFQSWRTTTGPELVGSMVAIFLAALTYEAIKYFREQLLCSAAQKVDNPNQTSYGGIGGSNELLLPAPIPRGAASPSQHPPFYKDSRHYWQTLLHLLQVTLGYLLMLVAMTFNVWCFLAVILGATAGHFLFGWKRLQTRIVRVVDDHC